MNEPAFCAVLPTFTEVLGFPKIILGTIGKNALLTVTKVMALSTTLKNAKVDGGFTFPFIWRIMTILRKDV